MNRQLYANGGIMTVAPREKFGLGSSLKKFVRKIIPNEINIFKVISASITNQADKAPIGPVKGYIRLILPTGTLLKA